jgi:hypothetical protein
MAISGRFQENPAQKREIPTPSIASSKQVARASPGRSLRSMGDHQATALSERLLADDMFSGWGLLTLSVNERRYNPMSYHNGRCGHMTMRSRRRAGHGTQNVAGVLRILESLFEASENQDFGSLPELFCGVSREDGLGPVPYPVACYPQAWSAAGVFLILLTILIKVMGFQRRVLIDSPAMPSWLEWLRIEDLKVGDETVSLILRRAADGASDDRDFGKSRVNLRRNQLIPLRAVAHRCGDPILQATRRLHDGYI